MEPNFPKVGLISTVDCEYMGRGRHIKGGIKFLLCANTGLHSLK